MIYKEEPTNWRDLQDKVAGIFSDCGCEIEVEKEISTVRGTVNIDVYVLDNTIKPRLTYLCECKYWSRPVSKNMVHAFRTVIQDSGAHVGYLISKVGFQSGAKDAALNTNTILVNWFEFQNLLIDRWKEHKYRSLLPLFDELFNYYDYLSAPIGNSIQGNKERLKEFENIIKRYHEPASACTWCNMMPQRKYPPKLPYIVKHIHSDGSLEELCFEDCNGLFDYLVEMAKEGLAEFKSFVEKYNTT